MRIQRDRIAFTLSLGLFALAANAQDVVIKTPPGGAVVITDPSGTIDRLRVKDTGQVSIASLLIDTQQSSPVCYGVGGVLGACASASGSAITLPYAGNGGSSAALFSITSQGPGDGIYGQTRSGGSGVAGVNDGGGAGVYGRSAAGNGVYGQARSSSSGVAGVNQANGAGVYGRSEGNGAGVRGQGTAGDGVYGDTSRGGSGVAGVNNGRGAGVYGRSAGGDGLYGEADSESSGVAGVNNGRGAGVYGRSGSGYAMRADGPAAQNANQGGWVKAMAVVAYSGDNRYFIDRCFNSQLPAEQASVKPCGIRIPKFGRGSITLDFGFNVGERFISVTPFVWRFGRSVVISQLGVGGQPDNTIDLVIRYSDVDAQCTAGQSGCEIGQLEGDTNVPFTILVF